MSKVPPSPSPPRAMQWAGLIIATLLTAVPMSIAYIAKNPCYLALSFPLGFLWYSLARFLYKRPEDYHLDELKIKHHVERQARKAGDLGAINLRGGRATGQGNPDSPQGVCVYERPKCRYQ